MQEHPLNPPTTIKESSENTFVGILTDKHLFMLEILLKKHFSEFDLKKLRENHALTGLSPTYYNIQLTFKSNEDADFYLVLAPTFRQFAYDEFHSYAKK